MASIIQICNIALSHVGLDSIESFDERSKPAQECKRLFDFVRDETLRDHDWGFARKQAALSLLAETRSGWDYVYAYPLDCVAFRGIYDQTGSNTGAIYDPETDEYTKYGKIKFQVGLSEDANKRVILTNEEDAEGIYTARVTDANAYDSAFLAVLALNLAVHLAIPLKRDKKLKASLIQDYLRRLGQAQAVSANEEEEPVDNSSSFTRARQ